MKPIILLCMFMARSMANGYGTVSVSYGQKTPAVVTYGSAPATPVKSYSAPIRSTYSAPAPAVPVVPVRSYYSPAPAVPVVPVQSYSAPAPAVPVVPVQSYGSSYGGSSSGPAAEPIPIMRYNHDMQEGSHHRISFETGHGIRQEEHTQIRMNPNAPGNDEDALAGKAMVTKTGSFSYISPEGQTIKTEYVADENGFRPTGAHLPVAPSHTPEVVQAMREFEAAFDLIARAAPENTGEAPQRNSWGDISSSSYSGPSSHMPGRVASRPVGRF